MYGGLLLDDAHIERETKSGSLSVWLQTTARMDFCLEWNECDRELGVCV